MKRLLPQTARKSSSFGIRVQTAIPLPRRGSRKGIKWLRWICKNNPCVSIGVGKDWSMSSFPSGGQTKKSRMMLDLNFRTTASSEQFLNYSWIEFRQLNSSIFGSELPVNFNTFRIAITCPSTNLLFETFHIRKRFSQSLAAHDANLYLSHV